MAAVFATRSFNEIAEKVLKKAMKRKKCLLKSYEQSHLIALLLQFSRRFSFIWFVTKTDVNNIVLLYKDEGVSLNLLYL